MAFGTGISAQGTDAGEVRGLQKEIACGCWFTSKGKIKPFLIKMEDEDGEILTVQVLEIYSQEKKNYAGTPSVEFNIGIELQNRFRRVKLIYYQSENRWVLNFHT